MPTALEKLLSNPDREPSKARRGVRIDIPLPLLDELKREAKAAHMSLPDYIVQTLSRRR